MFSFALSTPSASILVVEDEQFAREQMVAMLSRRFPAVQIFSAEDGARGLETYRAHRPDIVLTDIQMPHLDGLQMAKQILAEAPGAHLVVLSSHSETDHLLEAIKLGVRRYLLKPIDCRLLFDAVAECLVKIGLEKQVRRQEQYIRLLSQTVEQSKAVVAIADSSGAIVYVNGRFTEVTGYLPEEVLGMHLRQLYRHDTVLFEEVWDTASAGSEWHGESSNRKKDGGSYWAALTVTPLHDADGRISHFVTLSHDITGRKKRQEEIARVQRLEALGTLAGGMAHDFNNILTGVLGGVSLAQQVEDRGKQGCLLREAERATLRAAALARQLLTFARGGKPVKRPVAVRELLEEAVSLALGGSEVRGRVDPCAGVHALEVDREQLGQAFTNILHNAADAMPAGEVIVEAENVSLTAGNALGLAPGSYVRISFADSGPGIPEPQLQKVFDPYFSTKPGAAGLGLTCAHSIIARHGGHIAVESAAGSGTTFICYLPSTGNALSSPAAAPEKLRRRQTPGAAVLLMDDESVVRKVTSKMLQCLGYEVTVCNNGEDAVALYRRQQEGGAPFWAVIMDLNVVGGMGGKEAAQRILATDPTARLVVSSGYYDDPVLADYQQYGFCAVLPKPYTSAQLAQVMGSLGRLSPRFLAAS